MPYKARSRGFARRTGAVAETAAGLGKVALAYVMWTRVPIPEISVISVYPLMSGASDLLDGVSKILYGGCGLYDSHPAKFDCFEFYLFRKLTRRD